MNENEEICCICKHYLSFRMPEQIAKYGDHRGRCVQKDKASPGCAEISAQFAGVYPSEFSGEFMKEGEQEESKKFLIVEDESVCEKYESIFYQWDKE